MLTHNLGREGLETFINLLKCILLDQNIKVEVNIPYHMLNMIFRSSLNVLAVRGGGLHKKPGKLISYGD
jgi:hypothetical protein